MEAEVRRAAPVAEGRPVLSCHGLTKYYGVVCAVRNVSLSFSSGEIVCLAGDNGAGKSTLIQMLSGAITPDEGSIEVDGAAVDIKDPGTARALGIATVYQNLTLCPNLGVAENLVLELNRGAQIGGCSRSGTTDEGSTLPETVWVLSASCSTTTGARCDCCPAVRPSRWPSPGWWSLA